MNARAALRLSPLALATCLALLGCPTTGGGSGEDDDSGSGASSSSSAGSSSGGVSSSNAGTSGTATSASGASSSTATSTGSSSSTSLGHVLREPDPYEPNNAQRDSDCDGLTDEEEYSRTYAGGGKTDPHNPDSDGDGILDGVEVGALTIVAGDMQDCGVFGGDLDPSTATNPTVADTDGDGIPDGLEDLNRNGRVDEGESDPEDTDSDGDGLPDALEDANHNGIREPGETSPGLRDTDGDGIPDGIEDSNHDGIRQPTETDPRNPDTDGDGLLDGDEDRNWNHVKEPGETDPLSPDTDTDHDGIPDVRETQLGYDINNPDMDGDGLLDGEEDRNANGVVDANETNPRRADSDCDGLKDGEEDLNHNGVLDPGETDPRVADTDGDLLFDGLEKGVSVNPDPAHCPTVPLDADPTSTTDPRKADTDGDGINDGIEDVNRDGLRQTTETDPKRADTDGDGLPDGQEDLNHNHVVDVGETNPLVPDTDSDHDGLADFAEALYGTDAHNPDSDGDGIQDGQEDRNRDGKQNLGETNARSKDSDCDGLADGEEDANHNGVVDPGETDPLDADSDHDGIPDGVERGRTVNLEPTGCPAFVAAAEPASLTDPTLEDSDGDGIPDGAEDANHNGRVDNGELNPKNPADAQGVVSDVCTLDRLVPLTTHATAHPDPDLQFATLAAFSHRLDIRQAGTVVGQVAWDDTATAPVVVFALSRVPAAEETTPAVLAQHTAQALGSVGGGLRNPITQSLPCQHPPLDCTWDQFPAVLGSYDLQFSGDAFDAVNAMVTRLVAGATTGLPASLGAVGPFKLRMEFVRRSDHRAVILGAIMPASLYGVTSSSASFHLDDVTNGTALAQVGDTLGAQCDLFTTQPYPKVDILFVIDNSGSMGDDQDALDAAATATLTQLGGALVDWRVARITTDADFPHDVDIPMALTYGDTTGTADAAAHVWPFIKPADTSQAAFDAVVPIVRKLMKPGTGGWGVEAGWEPIRYQLQGNPDAAHRYLPATAAGAAENPWKLRADARLAVLVVTDTGEQSNNAQRTRRGWTNGNDGTTLQFFRGGPVNPAALAGTLNANTWDKNRDNEPAVFLGGIFTPLGVVAGGEEENTGDSPNLAAYHDTVNALGGVVGSLQDVTNIGPVVAAYMTAVVGNASPYSLQRAPVSSSLKVAIDGQPVTGCPWSDIPRSRVNGFDYDPFTRQVTFYGTCRPSNEPALLGKKMAVSYRSWADNTPNPDGTPAACGNGCTAPLVCNTSTNQCECPSSCGLAAGCAAPTVCDTSPAVCACACPADCGGSPENPRLRCDPGTCTFTCPADCGGPSPGSGFACNPTTCRYECAACDPATRPTTNGARYACDVTTCQWTCPEDCSTPSPGAGYRCDRQLCQYACTADCGGTCTGLQTCDPGGCRCVCNPNATCGPGMHFDTSTCTCACDTAALQCGPRAQPDEATCSCRCKPNCGVDGAHPELQCTGDTFCVQSLCSCENPAG